MPFPLEYSFPRYLAAKKSVDDRALNAHVLQTLAEHLPRTSDDRPLRVLEIGAGIGTMLERMLERDLFSHASYIALDAEIENQAYARKRLPQWAAEHGLTFSETARGQWTLSGDKQRVDIHFIDGDVFDFLETQEDRETWDLLVANAFLDLVDLPSTLPKLLRLLKPGGLFYFTINFDGLTILEPPLDPVFDERVMELYHRTMDERRVDGRPSGDSRTGRHLFEQLRRSRAQIQDAGASDWVVFPGPEGYPQDEAYFLHFIIHFFHSALVDAPQLDPKRFEDWVAGRHLQIENGELTYIAHQMDFMGQV